LDVAAAHGASYRESADQLAFLHAELEGLRGPAHDVDTALDVLGTGVQTHLQTQPGRGMWLGAR
jgi:hypothetical protein